MAEFITKATALWEKVPPYVRKPARDAVAIFIGLIVAGGVLNQASPDWHALILTTKAAAGLATWRVLRDLLGQAPTSA